MTAVTTTTVACAAYGATDAGFRAWAKAHHDALIGAGLTLAYSGIDFNTATMPTVAQTVAGSNVYELNDALSGTAPIYVKIGFGRGSTSAAQAGFRIDVQIGSGHNGSGTLTGVTVSQYLTCNQAAPSDGQILVYRSEAGFALMSNFTNTYQTNWLVVVERLSNGGEPTTDGAFSLVAGQATNTTSTSSGTGQAALINLISNTPSGPWQLTSAQLPGFFAYNANNSYAGYAPLGRILTFGKYDCLTTVFMASRTPLGSDNVAYYGVLDGETVTFRTLYGCNFTGTSYAVPSVRTS